jgi:hypothetical protein
MESSDFFRRSSSFNTGASGVGSGGEGGGGIGDDPDPLPLPPDLPEDTGICIIWGGLGLDRHIYGFSNMFSF